MLRRIKNLILHKQPVVNNLSAGPWLKGRVPKVGGSSDGILFDTARGDPFVGNFVATPSSGAVITPTSITLDSDTPVNVDILLQNAGSDVNQCFDDWEIEVQYELTGPFGGAGVPGVLSGYKNEIASWSGIMDQGHGGSGGGTVLPTKWLQNGAAGYGTGGQTIGSGIPCSNKTNLLEGSLVLSGVYDGNTLLDETLPLVFTPSTLEIPRMFSKIGLNFLGGHVVINSIKISAAYPNAKYSLIGDSITQGRFASTYPEGWGSIFRTTYPDDTILCGAPGAVIADWTADNIAAVAKMKPKYAIVMLGTNDSATRTLTQMQTDYAALVASIESHGVQLVTVGIPPNGRLVTGQFNSWLQATYPRYIDCYDPLLGTGIDMDIAYDSGDGIHPNSAGHLVIANTIKAAITANGWN
jgi:lysophospholipase L1-like esterase